jgi:hypothetical protein
VEVYPYDYAEANLLAANILRAPMTRPGVNAVFIHRGKQAYDGKNPTNKLEPQWYNQTPAIMPLTLRLYTGEKGRVARIECFRDDPSMEAMEINDPDYDMLKGTLFGED